MDDFASALEFKPDYLGAHLGIVVTYQRTGMPDKARQALEDAPEETIGPNGIVIATKTEAINGVLKDIDP